MTKETYRFDTKKTCRQMWFFLLTILGLIWVVCLFRFYLDKSCHSGFYVWLGLIPPAFLSLVYLTAWLLIRNISYEISSVKVIKKRGDKIVCSIDLCDVQSFIAKEIITLKVLGGKDFLFRGIGTKTSRERLLTVLRELGIREIKRKKLKPAQVVIISVAILCIIHFLFSVTMWVVFTCSHLKLYRVGIDWPMFLHAIPAVAFLLMPVVALWLACRRKCGSAVFLLGLTILASVACFIYEKEKDFYQWQTGEYCTWWLCRLFDRPEKSERSGYSPTYYRIGYINRTGQIVIEPNSDFAGDFSEGLASVGYRINIEDADDEVIERQSWRFNQDFPFKLFNAGEQCVHLYGFIDTAGRIVIEPQFDGTRPFSDGMSRVTIGDKYGYINRSGEIVIEPQFDYRAGDFSEGLAAVFVDEKYIFIDKQGEEAFPERFNRANRFSGGFASVKVDGKWGYIDRTGQMVIEPQFDYARRFHNGMAAVEINGKWGFIDESGSVVIEPKFGAAFGFHEDLGIVRIDGKWGLVEKWGCIDNTGSIVIEPRFHYPIRFSEGLAHVCYAEGWGYREKYWWEWIDKTGTTINRPYFDKAYFFSEGLAEVEIDDKCGYINRNGELVIEPQFDTAGPFSEGLARIGVEIAKEWDN